MHPTVYISGGDAVRYGAYIRAVELAGGRPRMCGDAAACDALLLPGGGDMEAWRYGQENRACRGLEPERDARELELLAVYTARRRPVLGVCRGMQVVSVFFGGTLFQDIEGHSRTAGKDRLHTVYAPAEEYNLLRELYGERCIVNSCHHQAVDRLGDGLVILQRAEDGIVEAFCHRELPVLGVQWHPERLPGETAGGAVDGGALYRAFVERI